MARSTVTEETSPQITAPVCYRHTDRETWVSCVRCGRPICPDCMRPASVGFQCPECVREGRATTPAARTVFGGRLSGERGLVTRTLIWVNIAFWLLTLALAALSYPLTVTAFTRLLLFGGITNVTEWGAAIPPLIAKGEFYRLLTADFLHYGIIHIGFNMYALWLLGRECERLLGRWRFIALYLFAGVGGSVAVYLFGASATASAGASASIFGLLSALFFFFRRMNADVRGLVFLIVLNFGLGFYIANISILGHLGGLVVGAVVGALFAYVPAGPNRTRIQVGGLAAIGLILTLLVAIRTAQLGVLG